MFPQNRAILYARVSTPRQAELYSLDYQIEEEQAYATAEGLRIVAEFRDDQSGRKIERDGLEEACQMLEQNLADILVVWKFDRLHRHYVNSVLMRERIKKAGKQIHYAQSRIVSGKTARERLPEDLQFIMAEIDADDILERTQAGRRRKIEVGGKWLGVGDAPFGYRKEGAGRDVQLVIDEEDAKIVRNIYEWFVNGEGDGPISMINIVRKLTALNIPTPSDRHPKKAARKIRGYAQWSRGTVNGILRDETYAGTFYQYRFKKVDGKMRRNLNREEWRGVPVPRIVEQNLWEAAQRKIDASRKISDGNSKYEYLVGRRVWCPCGYKMRAVTYDKPKDFGKAGRYRYQYYRCPGTDLQYERSRTCDMPVLPVAEVDAMVWQWVKEEIGNPIVLERKLIEIQAGQKQDNVGKEEQLQALTEHKAQIEQELKRLALLYAKDDMPAYLLDQLITEQNAKLGLTNAEIAKLTQQIETPLTDEAISNLLAFSVAFQEHLQAVEQSFEKKRVVIDGLDVTVEAIRRDDGIYLRMKSILNREGNFQIISAASYS